MATGEFVFFVADDDFAFDRAIAALPAKIDEIGNDHAIAAITGGYLIEGSRGTSIVEYKNLEADDVTARMAGYLSFEGVNVLVYSAIRHALASRIFDFMNSMPFSFSFHDQILCLLYLLNGKFVGLKRLLYLYDIGEWETAQTAQARDIKFYGSSDLDPAMNKLHWFLCGFEGAMLIRNADMFPDHSLAQRQIMADRWFSTMFSRFLTNPRATFNSRFTADADRFCEKWKTSAGRLPFEQMLADICDFIALFSKDISWKYFTFWREILNRTKAPSLTP